MRLTDILSIYGASLSTATAVWNYFRTKPQVRVLLVLAYENVGDKMQTGIGISIQNVSNHPAHITNISIMYPIRKSTILSKLKHMVRFKQIPRTDGWCHCTLKFHGIEDGCPVSIEPAKAHWIFVCDKVLKGLLKDTVSHHIKVVAQDALWRNTYSKSFVYPVKLSI